jgi:ubiquinone/menaquinone biosynthesis C-methylase UbiE
MARQLRRPSGRLARRVGEKMNESNAHLYELVLAEMALEKGDRVLEIGFGNGYFFSELLAQTYTPVHGLDFSKAMMSEAKRINRAALRSGRLVLEYGDSSAMPFADASFDKVCCVNVIYFWEDPAAHLREIRRVLRPGGVFYAGFRPADSLSKMPFAPYGFRHYDVEAWAKVLEENSFVVRSSRATKDTPTYYLGEKFELESVVVAA